MGNQSEADSSVGSPLGSAEPDSSDYLVTDTKSISAAPSESEGRDAPNEQARPHADLTLPKILGWLREPYESAFMTNTSRSLVAVNHSKTLEGVRENFGTELARRVGIIQKKEAWRDVVRFAAQRVSAVSFLFLTLTLFLAPVWYLSQTPWTRLFVACLWITLIGITLGLSVIHLPLSTRNGKVLGLVLLFLISSITVTLTDRKLWNSSILAAGMLTAVLVLFSIPFITVHPYFRQKQSETERLPAFLQLSVGASYGTIAAIALIILLARQWWPTDGTVWVVVGITGVILGTAILGYFLLAALLFLVSSLVTYTWRALILGAILLSGVAAIVVLDERIPTDPVWLSGGLRIGLWWVMASLGLSFLILLFELIFDATVRRWKSHVEPVAEVVNQLLGVILRLEFGPYEKVDLEGDVDAQFHELRERASTPSSGDLESRRSVAKELTFIAKSLEVDIPRKLKTGEYQIDDCVRAEGQRMGTAVRQWALGIMVGGMSERRQHVGAMSRSLAGVAAGEWQSFERAKPDESITRPSVIRRALYALRALAVAVMPLAAIGVVYVLNINMPDALQGSLLTFGVAWFVVHLLRWLDPRIGENVDIADKLLSGIGGMK